MLVKARDLLISWALTYVGEHSKNKWWAVQDLNLRPPVCKLFACVDFIEFTGFIYADCARIGSFWAQFRNPRATKLSYLHGRLPYALGWEVPIRKAFNSQFIEFLGQVVGIL
jgi:hypothetical protein